MRRAWRAVGPGRLRVLMLALALLSGCSLNPPLELDTLAPAGTAVRLSSVPFFAQSEFQCGPAALAGVLGAAGVATDPATLSPQVYLPAREGSLQLELVAATRRAGRLPYVLAGEPRAPARATAGGPSGAGAAESRHAARAGVALRGAHRLRCRAQPPVPQQRQRTRAARARAGVPAHVGVGGTLGHGRAETRRAAGRRRSRSATSRQPRPSSASRTAMPPRVPGRRPPTPGPSSRWRISRWAISPIATRRWRVPPRITVTGSHTTPAIPRSRTTWHRCSARSAARAAPRRCCGRWRRRCRMIRPGRARSTRR